MYEKKRLSPEEIAHVRKAVEHPSPGMELLRTLLGHIDAQEEEIARLKPSGQVAEDEATLRQLLGVLDSTNAYYGAISRLAAKAQGYEAALLDVADRVHERDAAVASNARLLGLIIGMEEGDADEMTRAKVIIRNKHELPGTALLEQHRKEVEQARNDALEEAARTCELHGDVAQGWALVREAARQIRLKKTPAANGRSDS